MGFIQENEKNQENYGAKCSTCGIKIVIYGQMTAKEWETFFKIIPRKQKLWKLSGGVSSGICGIFSTKNQENREISVSLVKISKNGCRRRRAVV